MRKISFSVAVILLVGGFFAAKNVFATVAPGNPATIVLDKSNLTRVYDGTAQSVAVLSTDPAALSYSVTYNGSTEAPASAGTYTVVASVNSPGYVGSDSAALTISKAEQTIDFGPLSDKTVGDEAFGVGATASSGLPVYFTASPSDICAADGKIYLAGGTGACTVVAHQDGDENHGPAKDFAQTFTVNAADPPSDVDDDGVADKTDRCPFVYNPGQEDSDNDKIGDACDNCKFTANADQADDDGDNIGNACDQYNCQSSNGGVEACDDIDNDCDGYSDEDNACTESDTTPPQVTRATAYSSNSVQIVFDENLQNNDDHRPRIADFCVYRKMYDLKAQFVETKRCVDGEAIDISGISANNNVVTLTLADHFRAGDDPHYQLIPAIIPSTIIDEAGNQIVEKTVGPIGDGINPVITLNGEATVTVAFGSVYEDQGASCNDVWGGKLEVEVGGKKVNTGVAGTYMVTYDCYDGEDGSGNEANQVARTVIVSPQQNSGGGGSTGGSGYVPTAGFGGAAGCPTVSAPEGGFSVGPGGNVSDRNVVLALRGGNAVNMSISNSSDFVGASIEPYAASKPWTLTEGIGAKQVFARFYNACGIPTNIVAGIFNYGTHPSGQVLGERISLLDELIAATEYGERSSKVKEMQGLLQDAGYFPKSMALTGFYGPITKAAVAKYQAAQAVDGLIAGLEPGDRSEDVRKLQNALKTLGFFPRNVASTGFYGPLTQAAVAKYQASKR